MSDQSNRHPLDDHDEVLSVHSRDILEVVSRGPITREATDAERTELYKHMAFEADKEVKRLQAETSGRGAQLRALHDRMRELRGLIANADDDLAHYQNLGGKHWINNARTSLTKALEGWE